ncbi:MAG: hypothetical protein FJ087_01535 [Deltaproteobacteria bacterium]|nr:hypothetical protein [Deltaproteobacteria bacterium]
MVDELKAALVKLLRAGSPELRGMHPVQARVVKTHGDAGAMTEAEPRYSVDVQVLRRDGGDDPDWPVIPDVECPVLWAGPGCGVYAMPAVGAVVRVGFLYGDRSCPVVEGVSGRGFNAPGVLAGQLLIDAGSTCISVQRNGVIRIRGTGAELDGGSGTVLISGLNVVLDGQVQAGGVGAELPVMVMGPSGPTTATRLRAI